MWVTSGTMNMNTVMQGKGMIGIITIPPICVIVLLYFIYISLEAILSVYQNIYNLDLLSQISISLTYKTILEII